MSCKSCHNHNNCFNDYKPLHGCKADGCRCGIPKADYCCDGGFHNGYGNYGHGWNNYRVDNPYYDNIYGRRYGAASYFNRPKNPVYGGYYNYLGIPNINTRSDYFTTF